LAMLIATALSLHNETQSVKLEAQRKAARRNVTFG
jgi:hypothetical protein